MSEQSADVPPPDEEWLREAAWDTDPLASWEIASQERLDEVEKEHRKNKVLVIKHAGKIIVAFMYFFTTVFAFSVGSWFFHFLTPEAWHWMSEAQLSKIQAVIFSGSLGAILTSLAQRYFMK